MLNSEILLKNIFDANAEKAATRDGFGHGVVEAGKMDENIVVLTADLAESTRAEWFKKEFPERFVEVGVAEQNLATVGSGMAAMGKVAFITSYAAFSPGRNYEQIRTTIALNDRPVKICGMHAGISVGPDGATHQMLEDIGLMRMLPNMIVVVPCDAEEGRKATIAAAQNGKPTYLRFGREATPTLTRSETPFTIGKAYRVWESDNITKEKKAIGIVACGSLLIEAIKAAQELSKQGIATIVVNNHTIKPLDEEAILALAQETKALITVEEHQIMGGMGSAVAEFLAQNYPTPITMIGIKDQFGQSGTPQELMRHYEIDAAAIVVAARKLDKK